MHFRFRADINPARRLIQNQDDRICRQPFADDDFLLIAAAQVIHDLFQRRNFDAQALHVIVANIHFFLAINQIHELGKFRVNRHREIFPRGHRQH